MKKLISVFISVLLLCACFAGALAYADNSLVLGINAVNGTLGEGHSLIFTRKNGNFVSTSSAGLCWWRSATFEWSDADDAYIVTSVNLTVDGTNGKNNYVPENGFVLLVNIGNDYGSINYINKLSTDTYNKLAELKIGDRAYVTGIDLAKGTIQTSGGKHYEKDFTSDGKIYIGSKPENVDIYRPDTSLPQLESVVLPESGSVIRTDGINVAWDAVEGADEYIVTVNTSTVITDGTVIVNGIKTCSDSLDEVITRWLNPGWSLTRISNVDHAILLVGAYELIYTDTATGVIINEAVELAKKYSDDKAGSFVNGVLGNIGRSVRNA